MAAPTVYRWDDIGAPKMRRNNMPEMQAVFQACLIDGYGTKLPPVSGTNKWTIPFSDATSFILQQGGTAARKCAIKLYNLNSTSVYMRVIAAVDWTDLNTPVTQWAGGTANHRLPAGSTSTSTRYIPWIIFATERAIYVQFGHNTLFNSEIPPVFNTFAASGGKGMNNYHWFFGDYKPIDPAQTHNQLLSLVNTGSATTSVYTGILVTKSTSLIYNVLSGTRDNVDKEVPSEFLFNKPSVANLSAAINEPLAVTDQTYSPIYPGENALYVDSYRIIAERTLMGEMPGLLYCTATFPFPGYNDIYPFTNGGEEIYICNTEPGGIYMVRTSDWGVE